MNEMEVIGIRCVDGVSKKTGQPYRGYNVYVSYKRKDVSGVACESMYLSEARFPAGLSVGDLVRPYYNRFGSVELLEVL